MKKLREIHLYLGCLFAPMLIFFAVTGAWQLFDLHRGRKDNSYTPPRWVSLLSDIHQHQHISPANSPSPLRYFFLAGALGLVITTILGIVMAFRFGRNQTGVILSLVGGVAVPVAFLLVYH